MRARIPTDSGLFVRLAMALALSEFLRPAAGNRPCIPKFECSVAIRNEPGNLCLHETAWWGWEDSNLQPNDYQPPALSIEHSGAEAQASIPTRQGGSFSKNFRT
jgi:hypothetical protein